MIKFRPFDIVLDRNFVVDALYETRSLTGEPAEDPVKDSDDLMEGIAKGQNKNTNYASVMLEEEEKIGFVFFFPLEKNHDIGYICFDYLIENKRGMGLGRHLMDLAVNMLIGQDCREVFLAVSKKNLRAIKFYEKYGFEIFEERDEKHYKMRKII